MAMKVSREGLMEIAAHEGIVTSPYKDSVNVWTVGIGHTASAGYPNPAKDRREYTIAEVMDIFARDIAKFEARVNRAFKVPLKQHEFDAAVSFDFNTGGIHKASWVKDINAGNRAAAKSAFMRWRKPPEIIPRRQKECDLFFHRKYSSGGMANVYPASPGGKVLWSQGKRKNIQALMDSVSESIQAPQMASLPSPVADVLDDADKPLGASKTVWGAALAAGSSALSSLGMLPERVSLALIAVAVLAAIFIIWDRRRKAKLAHQAKASV